VPPPHLFKPTVGVDIRRLLWTRGFRVETINEIGGVNVNNSEKNSRVAQERR
jgi:hypothetical protein